MPKHTTYVLNGAAGNREGNLNDPVSEDWMATYSSAYGLGKLTFYNGSKLKYDFIQSSDSKVLDTFILERKRN